MVFSRLELVPTDAEGFSFCPDHEAENQSTYKCDSAKWVRDSFDHAFVVCSASDRVRCTQGMRFMLAITRAQVSIS